MLPDLETGGGQQIALQIARNVDPRRFDSRVVYLEPVETMLPAFRAAGLPTVGMGHEPGRGLRTVRRLARYLRDERIDLVHVHGQLDRRYGEVAAFLTRTPVVSHAHSMWVYLGVHVEPGTGPLARARAEVMGRLRDLLEHRTVRHYVADSDEAGRRYAAVARAPVTTYRQGVDLARFPPPGDAGASARTAAVRDGLGLDPSVPVLVNVSRLVPEKGQADLVEALVSVRRSCPDAVLVLVGDGPERPRLEARAAELGVAGSVVFTGNRHDVPDLLAAGDVFVFSSESESFGLAVLEAMAAGRPVVSYRLPSLEEFVMEGATGVLVDHGDTASLAAATGELLADPSRASAMGEAGRRVVEERFDARVVHEELGRTYEQVLAGVGRGRR
ncbi:MAG: glycosyltransferase [Acidimicrobiia bacterium]|nr:glycosyltransferase [Acidimicrobiia bacterium]